MVKIVKTEYYSPDITAASTYTSTPTIISTSDDLPITFTVSTYTNTAVAAPPLRLIPISYVLDNGMEIEDQCHCEECAMLKCALMTEPEDKD